MKTKMSGIIVMAVVAAGMGLRTVALGAETRVWKSAAGSELEAELVRADGDRVVLRKADGRQIIVRAEQLGAADREYLAAIQAEAERAAAKFKAAIPTALEGKLVKRDGDDLRKFDLADGDSAAPDYYAIYYSAHWCGPCREFTPKLVEFYNEQKPKHANFEIVFVSSDHSKDAMEGYMAEASMPWPALEFDEKDRAEAITRFAGGGIPCLVLVTPDGKVLSDSYVDGEYVGPTSVMRALKNLLEKPADS